MPSNFQKGNKKQKAKDFSVKVVTASEALQILQTIKKMPDEKIVEATNIVRSMRGLCETLTVKQRRLIYGIYVAVMSGFEQANMSTICKGLGLNRQVWYSIVEGENLDKARLAVTWLDQLIKNASKSHFSSITASMINQAEKGSVKHQELFYKVNGYLTPDTTPGGVVVNFQTFRNLPTAEAVEGKIVEQANSQPLNQGSPELPPNVSTMPQEEVESLIPFLKEEEPMPEEKRPNPHGKRYHQPNHFSGPELV